MPTRFTLSVIPYAGVPGHIAVVLADGENKRFFSLNSFTHAFILAGKNPYDDAPKEDLADWIIHTLNSQVKPMANSPALVVTDPKELSAELPKATQITLSSAQYEKAHAFLTETARRVAEGTIRYSIIQRQQGQIKFDNCASIAAELLKVIAKPDEQKLLKPTSFIETYISETPQGVAARAEQLAAHRQKQILTTTTQPKQPRHLLARLGVSLFRNVQTTTGSGPTQIHPLALKSPFRRS